MCNKLPVPSSRANGKPDHSRWVKEAESNEKLEKPWEAKTEEEDAQQALSGEGPRAIDALPPAPPDAEKVNSPGVSQEEGKPFYPCGTGVHCLQNWHFFFALNHYRALVNGWKSQVSAHVVRLVIPV